VLALMSTGRSASPFVSEGTGGAGASEGSTLSAESFLAGQAASLVSSRVNVLFGLDRFRIDPLTGTSGESSSARVTVGKRLTRDVFATYSYDPSQTEEQILEVEWRVSPTFTLVLTQNGDGTYAVDGRWDTRF
jgi:translocation and assembly module TamB